jgi:replication initiation and membrane attachment protein DnaB
MVSPKQRQDARETQKQRMMEIQAENEYFQYLLTAGIDDLYDDGYRFVGETEKDKIVTQFDFDHFRSLLQKPGVQYTKDEIETLMRCIKLCIESPA